MLFNTQGHGLIQRRSKEKARFSELWANTCCSHPDVDEDIIASAKSRLIEELNLTVPKLTQLNHFIYRAEDPHSGYVEHEFDHVLTGICDNEPRPDPSEVQDWRWMTKAQLHRELQISPQDYAPWLHGVLRELDKHW